MPILRSVLFNAAFYLWTIALGIALVPALPFRRATLAISRLWCRGALALARVCIGLSYEVQGVQHLPRGPAIVAAKHQSAWETLAFPVILDDPAIVLKRELLLIPLVGWALARLGMVAIDRRAGARALRGLLAAVRSRLAAGRPVLVFPEGTRTLPGTTRPYQPGIAALYLACGVPVVPVALNAGLFWGRRAFVKRPGRIVVRLLAPIPPGLPREAFMARLQAAIEGESVALLDYNPEHTVNSA